MYHPVHEIDNQWYFWDEAQYHRYGPYSNMPDALDALMKYNKELDKYENEQLKTHVKEWMQLHHTYYTGPTKLAEAAADDFGYDEWLDNFDHWVWDLALEYYNENL